MQHTWRLVRIRSLRCKQIYGLTTSQSTNSEPRRPVLSGTPIRPSMGPSNRLLVFGWIRLTSMRLHAGRVRVRQQDDPRQVKNGPLCSSRPRTGKFTLGTTSP